MHYHRCEKRSGKKSTHYIMWAFLTLYAYFLYFLKLIFVYRIYLSIYLFAYRMCYIFSFPGSWQSEGKTQGFPEETLQQCIGWWVVVNPYHFFQSLLLFQNATVLSIATHCS